MSTRVWGYIESLTSTFNEQADLAFYINKCATDNLIGINLGGNALPHTRLKSSQPMSSIRFELTDNLLDNVAECLFCGDDVTVSICGSRVDKENLYCRE